MTNPAPETVEAGPWKGGPVGPTPDVTTQFTDKKTLLNLSAWTVSPLQSVGNNSTPLSATPAHLDSASMSGLKGQSYTTWNCTGRSLIIGAVCSKKSGSDSESDKFSLLGVTTDTEDDLITDLKEIKKQVELTPKQVSLIERGSLGYSRALDGLVRLSEYEKRLEEVETFVKSMCTVKPKTSNTVQPLYTYSDTIPIRSVQPTTWNNEEDQGKGVPYTDYFHQLTARLTEPNASAPLMSVVRGPANRDTMAIIGLARTLAAMAETPKESAAMLRSLCIATAWDNNAQYVDPTILKWIRGCSQVGGKADFHRSFHWGAKTDYPDGKIVAVPLDIAVEIGLNKTTAGHLADFPYNAMDTSWTMIPIRQTFMMNRASFIYVLSFLDSAYWNGRLNYWRNVTWADGDDVRYGSITQMPNSNSVRIPGPISVLLVLVDCTATSRPQTVRLGSVNVDIPVFGGVANVNPANIRDMWEAYWGGMYEDDFIRGDAVSSFNEICNWLGVDDAPGRALSLAAELFLGNYPGVAVVPTKDRKDYKKDTCYGGYTMDGVSKLDPGDNNLSSDVYPDFDNEDARQMLVGFNFGVQTPYHVSPTSLTRITYVAHRVEPQMEDYQWVEGYWAVNGYDGHILYDRPRYTVYTASSLMRLCIATALVATHDQDYVIKSGPAAANYINMLGTAIALSTANLLAANDLDVRTWTGWQKTNDLNNMYTYYQKAMCVATRHTLVWTDMVAVYNGTGEWSWNKIETYFDVSPVNDQDWGSHSSWPIHAILQWLQKLDLAGNPPTPALDNVITSDGQYLQGLVLKPSYGQYSGIFAGTIDFGRYAPVTYSKAVGKQEANLLMWVDRWNYDSGFNLSRCADYKFFTSHFAIRGVEERWYSTSQTNLFMLLDCRANYVGDDNRLVRVTKIIYPDPPIWQTFLRLARDYLLVPGWEGLKHFLATGEVLPAVAKAGAKVVEQLQADIEKKKEEAETKERVEAMMGHPRAPPNASEMTSTVPT